MSLGPFDLDGSAFLTLYLCLLAAALLAGFLIPARFRPEGRRQRVGDVDALAFLAGGAARFGDSVVARMLAAHTLTLAGRDRFEARPAGAAATAAERSLLALPQPMRWRELSRALESQAKALERKLESAGLLMDADRLAALRFRATLPYLLLTGFGAVKLIVGDARDRPIGFLTALLVATVVLAAARWFSVDRRTRAGIEAVNEARAQSARLRQAPTTPEIGLAVALFGTAVLVGSGWSDFHRLRGGDGGGGGGGGGDGGDGGGGGCGGGGCGGCGGG